MSQILRKPEVLLRVGLKTTAFYTLIKSSRFPKPVRIGPKAVGWPSDEVELVLTAMVAGLPAKQIKELVSQIHSKRKTNFDELLGIAL
jgi:prophage regulatory protein